MFTVGLLATIEAKPEHAQAVAELMVRVPDQSDLVWHLRRFPSDTARQAHLDGQIAAALMTIAGDKLATLPEIKAVDILARKIILQR